jgi:hypothetical protein
LELGDSLWMNVVDNHNQIWDWLSKTSDASQS